MKETRQVLIGIVMILIAAAAATLFFIQEKDRRREVEKASFQPMDVETKTLEAQNLEEITIELYFYNPQQAAPGEQFLQSRKRVVYQTDNISLMARQIISELFAGDKEERDNAEEGSLFPEQARLRQFYLLDGVAVVDLSRETADGLKGGITMELAALYSITRSLRENIPEIREVRFLVEGRQRATLSGHVSIMQPFM